MIEHNTELSVVKFRETAANIEAEAGGRRVQKMILYAKIEEIDRRGERKWNQ